MKTVYIHSNSNDGYEIALEFTSEELKNIIEGFECLINEGYYGHPNMSKNLQEILTNIGKGEEWY